MSDDQAPLTCHVLRSSLRDLMYLYLPKPEDFDQLPEVLRRRFGAPEYAMELTLTPGRKLASADVLQVMRALREQGYYLQLPPQDPRLLEQVERELVEQLRQAGEIGS